MARESLLNSKIYARIIKKLHSDKKWYKFDALMALAEWGLTRNDVGEEIDEEVFGLIEETNFKMLCAEPLLLRDLAVSAVTKKSITPRSLIRLLNYAGYSSGVPFQEVKRAENIFLLNSIICSYLFSRSSLTSSMLKP